jgi:hypothetical protein
VDRETKRALRALADQDFEGNLSALVTDFAAEARRRMAAGRFLHLQGVPELSPSEAGRLEAAIARDVETARKRRKRRAG